MLTNADIRGCLRVWSLICKAKLLPLNVESGRFSIEKSWKKLLFCYLTYFHLLVRTCYVVVRLATSSLVRGYDPKKPHILTWDLIAALGISIFAFWYFVFFVQKRDACIMLLNQAYAVRQDEKEKPRQRGLISYLRDHSPQEIIAIWMPYGFFGAGLLLVAGFPLEQEFQTSFISVVPKESRSLILIGLWLCEEFWLLMTTLAISIVGISVHALSFEKYLNVIQSINKHAQTFKKRRDFTSVYCLLRCLQLTVLLFNESSAYIIFTFKQMCIGIAVLSGFGTVVSFRAHPIFTTCSTIICIEFLMVYGIVYEKAFAIPSGIAVGKRQLQAQIQMKMSLRGERKLLVKRMESIPAFGIRVGSFHRMERNSTPLFIDFVLRNLVGLLVFVG